MSRVVTIVPGSTPEDCVRELLAEAATRALGARSIVGIELREPHTFAVIVSMDSGEALARDFTILVDVRRGWVASVTFTDHILRKIALPFWTATVTELAFAFRRVAHSAPESELPEPV